MSSYLRGYFWVIDSYYKEDKSIDEIEAFVENGEAMDPTDFDKGARKALEDINKRRAHG